jgi:hypothetical protein
MLLGCAAPTALPRANGRFVISPMQCATACPTAALDGYSSDTACLTPTPVGREVHSPPWPQREQTNQRRVAI